jgi:hypothetical protein
MAGTALSTAKEVSLPGNGITRRHTFSRRPIQRADEGGQCIQLGRGQIKRRHARPGNSLLDDVA